MKTAEEVEILLQSEYFCIVPWVHLSFVPTGQVFPCCLTNYDQPIGNLKNQSFKEIWNSDKMKGLRRNFLKNRPVSSCRECNLSEKNNKNIFGTGHNQYFKHDISELISKTESDGALPNFQLKSIDFRPSNVCNFKCRTCGHNSSTKWFEDAKSIGKSWSPKAQIDISQYNPKAIQELISSSNQLRKLYFAGGEPLLMEEHYLFLENLIKEKKTNFQISYSTNLSTLKFKKWDILELWKNFENIELSLSIDDYGARGEYIRKGMVWGNILKNREELRKKVPHAKISVSSTISCLNIWHQPEFYQELLKHDFMQPDAFYMNHLYSPPQLSSQILPRQFKEEIKDKYEGFLTNANLHPAAARVFSGAMKTLFASDKTILLKEFLKETIQLDQLREESFSKIFPELSFLMENA